MGPLSRGEEWSTSEGQTRGSSPAEGRALPRGNPYPLRCHECRRRARSVKEASACHRGGRAAASAARESGPVPGRHLHPYPHPRLHPRRRVVSLASPSPCWSFALGLRFAGPHPAVRHRDGHAPRTPTVGRRRSARRAGPPARSLVAGFASPTPSAHSTPPKPLRISHLAAPVRCSHSGGSRHDPIVSFPSRIARRDSETPSRTLPAHRGT